MFTPLSTATTEQMQRWADGVMKQKIRDLKNDPAGRAALAEDVIAAEQAIARQRAAYEIAPTPDVADRIDRAVARLAGNRAALAALGM